MAPALDATKYIYEGVWINWAHGPILGSTLTVSPQHASILSPALAILVSIAGSQLWTLSQYVLHQARATPDQRSFVYHQTQSILRNSASDFDALSRFSRLAIAWRHQKHARTLALVGPLFAWALLHFLLVVFAGVFSSVVLAGDSDVLSRSPWCGTFNYTYIDDVYYPKNKDDAKIITLTNEYNSYANSRISFVQQTVDICGDGFQHCDGPRPKPLPFTTTFIPDVCPVNSSICHPEAGGSMSFDTGFLSSHTHLGYNAAKEDRVSVRLTAQCSPLKPQGYVSSWQNTSTSLNSSSRQLCDARYGTGKYSTRNATATLTKKELTCDESMLEASYLLIPQEFFPGTSGRGLYATFDPIDELYTPHADLSLVTLASQNVHTSPVTDPWFSAQQVASPSESACDMGNDTLYKREYPLTAVACTQQWQICNNDVVNDTRSDSCTSPASFYQTLDQIDLITSKIVLTDRQLALAQRFMFAGQTSSIYYFVYALSQSSFVPLKARDAPHSRLRLPSHLISGRPKWSTGWNSSSQASSRPTWITAQVSSRPRLRTSMLRLQKMYQVLMQYWAKTTGCVRTRSSTPATTATSTSLPYYSQSSFAPSSSCWVYLSRTLQAVYACGNFAPPKQEQTAPNTVSRICGSPARTSICSANSMKSIMGRRGRFIGMVSQ